MRTIANLCSLTAVCVVAGLCGSTIPSHAGVMSIASKETISGSSLVEKAHYGHSYRHHWRYGYWRPHRHYQYYGYYPWYNPAGAVAGAAVGLATAPLWAFGGYPYYGYPYYY